MLHAVAYCSECTPITGVLLAHVQGRHGGMCRTGYIYSLQMQQPGIMLLQDKGWEWVG